MPSGAKKRKAAKKKKEKEASTNWSNSNSASHSHADVVFFQMDQTVVGDHELKHHDGKESNGGEVSSPASQDHHNQQHSFSDSDDEKVEKREGSSSIQTAVNDYESMGRVNNDVQYSQEVVIEDGGLVQIDRELKPGEDKSVNKDPSIEYVKTSSKSSVESSSSSSSDDESHANDMNRVVLGPASVDKLLSSAGHVSEASTQASKIIPVEESGKAVMEAAPAIDLDNVSILKELDHTKESATGGSSKISDVVELDLKENSENLSSLDEHKWVSSVEVDLIPQKKDDVVSISDQNAVLSSDLKDSAAGVGDDKLLTSFNATGVGSSVVVETTKDSEIPDRPSIQPPVAPLSKPVQSTSWKNCCGLFELFTDGNR